MANAIAQQKNINEILFAPGLKPETLEVVAVQRLRDGRERSEVQYDNWPSVLQYYTHDVEYQDPIVTIQGIDVMTGFLARLFGSTQDLVTTIEHEVCIDNEYMATWTVSGDLGWQR